MSQGVRNVTLTSIAQRVGVAPSHVLSNYGTRDEIYLDLLIATRAEWVDALEQALECLPPESGRVAKAIVQTLAARPLYCDLVAHIGPSEYNVSTDATRRALESGLGNTSRLYALFIRSFSITEQQAYDLSVAINSFITSWWMRSQATTSIPADESGRHLGCNLEARLARWIKTFIDGLLAERPRRGDAPRQPKG